MTEWREFSHEDEVLRAGREAWYLEHFPEADYQYELWCSAHGMDPEDVGSAVAYEEHFAEMLEALS